MSRIALIGDNSVEYIDILLDIWNTGNCAVLIDKQFPAFALKKMMYEANVVKCYIQTKYYQYLCVDKEFYDKIDFITYESNTFTAQLLPKSVYYKFKENYSHNEAVVIYSSGTTGDSKGIILSHYAINTNADSIINYIELTKTDRIYIVKNLTHASTFTGELLVALKTNKSLLISPTIVPPRYVLNNIHKYGITIIGVNPMLLSMYAKEYISEKYDLSSLKKIYVSGSILSDKIYHTAHTVFKNQKIYNVYGLSELGPRVTAQRHDCCNSNSVGKVIKGVDIALVNEKGMIVNNGERGIIHVYSPSKFTGYIHGSVKHKSLYKDWLNTGDIGYLDDNFELHIVGRIDDLIIIDSHKIYPADIERQIQSLTNIDECVVTSMKFGKKNILCCLYSSNSDITSNIKEKLRTVLLNYEIPSFFVKTNEIPKSQNGKVLLDNVKNIIVEKIKNRNM